MEHSNPMHGTAAISENYWGQATSTIDWCEENYVMCKYIAEFWNTVTNLAFLSLAVFGMWKVRSTGQENRFLLCYLGMFVVGTGSWLFHMTLQYQWQLADELPMVYCTCVCIYCALRADAKVGTDVFISLALFSYSAVVTLVYLQVRNPVFHQVAYAVEVFIILIRSTMHQIEIRKSNWRAYNEMKQLFWAGAGTFGMAFVLWNVDNVFCANLRAIRNSLPPFLAPFFQLHAYWHIGTAIGCYASIVYQQYLRLVMLGTVDRYRLRWMTVGIPYIDAASKTD
ncbi:alkaline ceramidase 3 [Martensiomyces pterosporus]|nr:alkaline ceramidase 3 [Martensiomyces pterosporus]